MKGSDLASDNSEGVENEAFPVGKVVWACSNESSVPIFTFASKKDREGGPATIQNATVIADFDARRPGGADRILDGTGGPERTKLDCKPMPGYQFGVECSNSYSLLEITNDEPTLEVLRIRSVDEPFTAVIKRRQAKSLTCIGRNSSSGY